MRRALVLFAALLGGVSAAPGENASPVVEERITVTATATEEPVAEVPVSVDVLDRAEILAHEADQAIDLLRTLPGIDVVQSGSPGKTASLFLRGTNSNHTLVLWNGIELNDPNLGGFDWSTLALDGVERVEVVKGPYSALYGSSAVGGVVQLVTRSAEGPELDLRAEAGSNDLLRAGVSGGFRSGAFSLDVGGHLRRGEGEVDNDSFDSEEIDVGAGFDFGESAHLGALARAVANEIGVPFDFSGNPSPRREQEFDALSLAMPFEWTAGSGGLDALVARTETDIDFRDPDDPFAANRAESSRDQARLAGRFEPTAGLTVTLGGDFERQEATTGGAFGPGLVDVTQEEWSAFGQVAWQAGPVRVDAGVRRDDNEAFGEETSLRAAAAWAILPTLRLRGGYGESFRAPSLGDLYYPGFGNPELLPEGGESYEVALEGETGDSTRFDYSVAWFANDLDDLIEFDFTTFLPQNIGKAEVRGIEGSLGIRSGIFGGRLAVTWMDTEVVATGRELLRRPEEKASLVLFVRPGEWTCGATLRYVGDRLDFGDVPLDSFTTLDLTLARRFGERYEPFARVENVFDEEYEEVTGIPAPGTSFAAGIELSF
jgi:vitamin B12 transporter